MDWAQLVSLIPALGAIRQGGPEFNAFMQGYMGADEQMVGQQQRQQGLDQEAQRWASQDARLTAEDARQAEQDRWIRGQAENKATQGNIGDLMSMIPDVASRVAAAPPLQATEPSPFFGIPVQPTFEGADPAGAAQQEVSSLASLLGSPELGPKMTPFIGPAITRAQAAQANAWRKAVSDQIAKVESRQKDIGSDGLIQAGTILEVRHPKTGELVQVPYEEGLKITQTPPLKPTAPKQQPPNVGSFEDFVVRKFGPSPTAEQITVARKLYGDAGRSTVTVNAGGQSDDVKAIADAIVAGDQPPVLTGLYRMAAPVRAELGRQKYDLSSAQTDWNAVQRRVATLNGTQQTRLRQAAETAYHSLDIIEDLAGQWKGGRFPILNRAALAAARGGAMGPEAQSIATQLEAQIADLTSELGNVYMGGNSPTEHSLGLAAKNLSADWSLPQLLSAVALARKNLQIRLNSIKNTGVIGASENNPYAGRQTTGAADYVYDPATKTLKKIGG